MSAGAAGDGLLRGMYEGCISGRDLGIQRRPYHKNCKCALHKERGQCNHASRYNNVFYPIRRSWSEGSLALMNRCSTTSGVTSPRQSSPVAAAVQGGTMRKQMHLSLFKEEDEESDQVSNSN